MTFGGCQCGAIRYCVPNELHDPHLCHCRMCQKAAGNYFMALGGVKREAFTIMRGEIAWFQSSDAARRGFCRDCGTPLVFDPIGEDEIAITLGSLDDPAAIEPGVHYGSEAMMPWFARLHTLPKETTEASGDAGGEPHTTIRATNRQHPDHDTDDWPPPHSAR